MPTPSRVESHEPESDSSWSLPFTTESCRGEALASTSAAEGPAKALDSPAADGEKQKPEGEEADEDDAFHVQNVRAHAAGNVGRSADPASSSRRIFCSLVWMMGRIRQDLTTRLEAIVDQLGRRRDKHLRSADFFDVRELGMTWSSLGILRAPSTLVVADVWSARKERSDEGFHARQL